MNSHTDHLNPHLDEAQLVDLYYNEADDAARTHLRTCEHCTANYAVLRADLDSIAAPAIPARPADYGAQLWNNISAMLPAHKPAKAARARWFSGLPGIRALGLATACALLLAATFLAGRKWEHHAQPATSIATNNSATEHAGKDSRQRIVLVVLGDHLDRSERLLVNIKHGESAAPLQSEARDLLSANRLYRESAAQSGDPELAAALDRLERVLIEVSNQPGGLTPARLADLQKQMNTDNLLFEVRVLRSNLQSDIQNTNSGTPGKAAATPKGVSI